VVTVKRTAEASPYSPLAGDAARAYHPARREGVGIATVAEQGARRGPELAVRVAQLVTELDPGGAERVVYELATGLDRRRFEQVVISLQPATGEFASELSRAGVRVLSVGMRSKLDVFARARLARILREEAVQLLHTHMIHASYLGRRAARSAGVRAVISTVHVVERRWRPWHYWADRLTSHLVDVEVCVSEAVRRQTLRRAGLPPEKVRVILNGVDPARFRGPFDRAATRRSLGVPENSKLLVSLGRLRWQKGHDVAVRALAILLRDDPGIRLAVVGDGPERSRLARLVERLGLRDAVRMTGTRRDVPDVLAAADCVLAPSRYEGFGLAVAEALAAGRPVVASRVDSLCELVEDGVSGLLVEPDDPAALAAGALRVLRDGSLAESLGRRGRERAARCFPLDAMLRAHEALYEELLRSKGILP